MLPSQKELATEIMISMKIKPHTRSRKKNFIFTKKIKFKMAIKSYALRIGTLKNKKPMKIIYL